MFTSVDRNVSPTAMRIYGAAAVAAPVLLLLSTIAYVTEGEGINDGVLGGTIGVWSCFVLAIAFVGLARLLEPLAPKAAPIMAVIAIIGFTAGVGFNVSAIYNAHFGPEINEFVDEVEGSDAIAILAFLPWGWFAPLTFVLTGVLLWRTRATSRPTAALLVVAGVLFIASRPAKVAPIAVMSDCALVLAMVPLGWRLLARRSASAVPAVAGA